MLELLAALGNWLLNYLLHSSVLIAGLWALERTGALDGRLAAWRELLWRWALFGALLTASLQPLLAAWPSQQNETVAPPGLSIAQQRETLAAPDLRVEPVQAESALAARPATAAPDKSLATAWAALTLAWLLLGLAGLMLTSARWLQLHRQVRQLPSLSDARLLALAERQAARAGLRRPPLHISEHWASPVLLPGGAICLPRWALQRLDSGQMEAVLAHEIAHLRRRDPAWRLAAQLLLSLAWLQPLNRLALRRLDALAELACDDWAARQPAARLALAESLYACAQALQTRRLPALASAMAAGTGKNNPLLQRIHTLLEKPAMDTPKAPNQHRLQLLGVATLVAMALSLPMLGLVHADSPGWRSLGDWAGQLIEGGSHTRMNEQSPDGHLSIHISGSPVFNAAQDQVLRLSGGSLVIDESRAGLHRRASFSPADDGVQRRYTLNGLEQAPDAEGQRWLAEKIGEAAELLQGSGARVQRLLKLGGSEAVLADLASARSEHLRRGRMLAFLQTGPQSPATLSRLLQLSQTLDSDFERRQCLQALLKLQTLDEALQRSLLQALDGMDSDFERRQVLESLAPHLGQEPATLQAWAQAIAPMASDFEKRLVLTSLTERARLSPAQLDAALQASRTLDSDFEQRTALAGMAPHLNQATPAAVQSFAAAARRIDSDFERREALLTLLQHAPAQLSSYEAVLDGMAGMDSGFERRTVLTALAAQMPADAGLLRRYRLEARSLGDFERGQAERALDHLQPAN